jgi:hypothetical protein
LTVKRYLKLTNVSPTLFKLYAEDEMNFDQISALALTDDHELQERLWNNITQWQRNGATFRRLITETEVNMRTTLAALVHRLALQVFGRGYISNRIVLVNIEQTYLKPDAENIGQARGGMAIEDKRQYWKGRIEAAGQGGKTLFGWLLEQPQQELLELLAFCMAASLNTVPGRRMRHRMMWPRS